MYPEFSLCTAVLVRQVTPVTGYLRSCSFTDTLNGWASGDSGLIMHTSSGGNNWVIQNSGLNYQVSYITFLNKRIGWAVANDYFFQGTAILKTTDSGNNWNYSLFPDTSIIFKTICFMDSLHGFLGGLNGALYRTINGGTNWTVCIIDSGAYSLRNVNNFKFISSSTGYAVGGNFDAGGVVWKTTNNGLNWSSTYVSPEPIFDLVLTDSFNILGSGGDYEFGIESIKTTDNGANWTYKSLQAFGIGNSIAARTKTELWIAPGFGSNWELSQDGGNNYFPVPIPDSSGISDVKFVDSLHGWAVGANGSIYKFNRDVIGIKMINKNFPFVVNLSQNYPNPFNSQTKFLFSLSKVGNVTLTIYDIQGREVEQIVNKQLQPGIYSFSWLANEFSSGVYFYKLSEVTDDNIQYSLSKKMILLK